MNSSTSTERATLEEEEIRSESIPHAWIFEGVVFDDTLTFDKFGSIPLDSHECFVKIFKVLNELPENISLKDCTVLNIHNNKAVPALQVLMNIAIINLPRMDIPTCELLTNICIQFMQRGYNLSDFTPDRKYHPLPLFFRSSCSVRKRH